MDPGLDEEQEEQEEEEQAAAGVEGRQLQQHERLNVIASTAGLTRLQHLDLRELRSLITITGLAAGVMPGAAMGLTALTGLTYLSLQGGGACVGDTAAAALACCLTQLRHFDLWDCELGSTVCLKAIA